MARSPPRRRMRRESRFDVRRERDVLREECGVEGADAGASGRDAAGRADGQLQNTGTNDRDRDRDRDPTSWTRPCVASRASPTPRDR